jgi:hypothetical protein
MIAIAKCQLAGPTLRCVGLAKTSPIAFKSRRCSDVSDYPADAAFSKSTYKIYAVYCANRYKRYILTNSLRGVGRAKSHRDSRSPSASRTEKSGSSARNRNRHFATRHHVASRCRPRSVGAVDTFNVSANGLTGGGVAYAFTNNISAKFDFRHTSFNGYHRSGGMVTGLT